MSGRRTAPRILLAFALVTMVVSIAGFVISMVLNAFVLDKYDAYGEVPIPGSEVLHLPAGEVTVTFHTLLTGSTSGSGLPHSQAGDQHQPVRRLGAADLDRKHRQHNQYQQRFPGARVGRHGCGRG